MKAQLLCIGPYSKSIEKWLELRPERYEGIADGTTVTTTLFPCSNQKQAAMLADAFGFGLFEFNRHHFQDSVEIEVFKLKKYWGDDWDAQTALYEAGFHFIFLLDDNE